jgi:hypothetical protein
MIMRAFMAVPIANKKFVVDNGTGTAGGIAVGESQ